MAKKESTYYGKKEEELQLMTLDEFQKIAPARARRSLNRGLSDEHKKLLSKLRKKDNVQTHCRNMIIVPEMLGKTLKIYNGKSFESVTVRLEMLGHYLGEFAYTRKKVAHSAPGVGATRSSAAVSVK
jgi:small subunit ribosomal protein S19